MICWLGTEQHVASEMKLVHAQYLSRFTSIVKSPFFIIPFHVREEYKCMIDKEMQRLVNLDILKQDIFLIYNAYCQKELKITDFRFLNSRLQRVNLAFPLIRDTFAVLGSSKCECLLVLDLKYVHALLSNCQKIPKVTAVFYITLGPGYIKKFGNKEFV